MKNIISMNEREFLKIENSVKRILNSMDFNGDFHLLHIDSSTNSFCEVCYERIIYAYSKYMKIIGPKTEEMIQGEDSKAQVQNCKNIMYSYMCYLYGKYSEWEKFDLAGRLIDA